MHKTAFFLVIFSILSISLCVESCYEGYDSVAPSAYKPVFEKCFTHKSNPMCFDSCKKFFSASLMPLCNKDENLPKQPLPICRSSCEEYAFSCGLDSKEVCSEFTNEFPCTTGPLSEKGFIAPEATYHTLNGSVICREKGSNTLIPCSYYDREAYCQQLMYVGLPCQTAACCIQEKIKYENSCSDGSSGYCLFQCRSDGGYSIPCYSISSGYDKCYNLEFVSLYPSQCLQAIKGGNVKKTDDMYFSLF
eukprot:TRINITY_DN931_c0_g1_i1.p1 TRINITY_DN931_c0_g1~~TRINITY_DN931_c0_g1_i1.p1  ORF type:complete len:266 (-),score=54.37 TRINITY_DN931_c0_g1_i1:117-860(-)